jgi:L-lactate utilization protein LutB
MDIQKTIAALEANNMKTYMVKNKVDACTLALSLIAKKDVVGTGGSLTLDQCGIRDALGSGGYHFLDWHKPGIDPDEKNQLLVQSLSCDVFLTSSNAITENGELYNVDGRGNRVAAMIFGPKKVIVVAGRNKIVRGLAEAKERLETVAAPQNAIKLHKKTGCAAIGYCIGCHTPDRICCHTVISDFQRPNRIHVILVDEDLGL